MRFIGQLLLNRWSLLLVDLLTLFPLSLAIFHLVHTLSQPLTRDLLHESTETITGIAIMLIGWGVVLEERYALRDVFSPGGGPVSAFDRAIDRISKDLGLIMLLFGLFAEIAMEAVKIPDQVLSTTEIEAPILLLSTALLALGGLATLNHAIRMVYPPRH